VVNSFCGYASLGQGGEIEAEVQVAVGIISGQVKGNITGRERIELSRTARIFGNIVTLYWCWRRARCLTGNVRRAGRRSET